MRKVGPRLWLGLLALLLLGSLLGSLVVGERSIGATRVVSILVAGPIAGQALPKPPEAAWPTLDGAAAPRIADLAELERSRAAAIDRFIVWELRLPRAIGAALVGAALALSGAVMQALFRNPLADPGLVGVSAGGAGGAMAYLLLVVSVGRWVSTEADVAAWWVAAMVNHPAARVALPMLGSIAVSWLVYRLSQVRGQTDIATLLLTGLAVNALVGALIGYGVFLAQAETIRDFAFWSLGSLQRLDQSAAGLLAVAVGLLGVMLSFFWRRLNLLLLGEREARHLGVDVETTRRWLIFASAGVVGLAVSLTGMIGFIGLMTPHLCRMVLGPDHRWLLPAAGLLGAAILVLADVAARSWASPSELPVGILTATLGAPFFLFLLARRQRQHDCG